MTDNEKLRMQLIKLLSYRKYGLSRAIALASPVRNRTATCDEEAIYSKSKRLIDSCDDYIRVLIEHGIDHLGRDLSVFKDWPSLISFWCEVSKRCMSYLAATQQSNGGHGVLEELRELQNQLEAELPDIKLSEIQQIQ